MNEGHPNYYIIENGQNTEKSPGDLRRLAVTQKSSERLSAKTDVKNSQGVNNKRNCYGHNSFLSILIGAYNVIMLKNLTPIIIDNTY